MRASRPRLVSLTPTQGIRVLPGVGDGTLQPFVAHDIGHNAWTIALGDVDGDFMPDVAVGREIEDTVVVVRNGLLP